MPSWNDGETSEDSLSSFDVGNDDPPRPPIPDTIFDQDFTGYDDCDIRCNHDMPMYRYVCFDGDDSGRRFLGCGCKEDVMCDKIHWVDGQWPPTLKHSLIKLWTMYEQERDNRLHGDVEFSTQNYQLVLQKRELEKKNLELHKQLGSTLEHVAEMTNHDLELEVSKRKKAEDEVELEKTKRQKAEVQIASLKEEKKKLEYYIAELLKALNTHKDKVKKIAQICGE